ncbi:hypothetical protein P12x_005238 [Tundrisphaera lichenicola]|uniref:hypothetical protein n=1 Tax=Tundrisphaera lichenicola TaxID=2029860 RepID=UPI003EC02882
MTTLPHNTLTAASHVQEMAGKAGNEKLAFALTGLSIALVSVMAAKECMGLFREISRHDREHSGGRCR